MKPYESDYSITANIAAITGLAWSRSYLSVVVSGRPVPGQDSKLGRGGNRVVENCFSLFKAHSMLSEISGCFSGVPFIIHAPEL